MFEGFFDFLTYQTVLPLNAHYLTNFLILNSLSFFERSLLLMEKDDYRTDSLFLINPEAFRTQTIEEKSDR